MVLAGGFSMHLQGKTETRTLALQDKRTVRLEVPSTQPVAAMISRELM
jgi:hypothetical protein